MGHRPHRLAIQRHMGINAMQKEGSKAPCAESSSAPVGTIATSTGCWSYSEMQLPSLNSSLMRFGNGELRYDIGPGQHILG
jgi:hypothetical protein